MPVGRREFLAVGVGAAWAGVRGAAADPGLVVVRGGRVIDPSRGFDAVADVVIADGKIVRV